MNLISRILKLTVSLAVLIVIPIYFYLGSWEAITTLLGALFNCVNLYFIKEILVTILQKPSLSTLAFLIGIKFPVLYLLGYCLLAFLGFSPLYFLVGFSLLLTVIFLLQLAGGFNEVKDA